MKYLLLLVAAVCFSTNANALTGNDLIEALDTDKEFSSNGYAKGIIIGTVEMARIAGVICLDESMTHKQVIAIVEKNLRTNPEKWHIEATPLIYEAIRTASTCPELYRSVVPKSTDSGTPNNRVSPRRKQ